MIAVSWFVLTHDAELEMATARRLAHYTNTSHPTSNIPKPVKTHFFVNKLCWASYSILEKLLFHYTANLPRQFHYSFTLKTVKQAPEVQEAICMWCEAGQADRTDLRRRHWHIHDIESTQCCSKLSPDLQTHSSGTTCLLSEIYRFKSAAVRPPLARVMNVTPVYTLGFQLALSIFSTFNTI